MYRRVTRGKYTISIIEFTEYRRDLRCGRDIIIIIEQSSSSNGRMSRRTDDSYCALSIVCCVDIIRFLVRTRIFGLF